MKNMLAKKLIVAAIVIPSLAVAAINAPRIMSVQAQSAEEVCDTLTLVSGAAAETAGYTETDPVGAPNSLDVSVYSGGSFGAAVATETVIPPWLDPAVDANFATSGAIWISSDNNWPGGEGNDEGSASSSQWRLFRDTFALPEGATVESAELSYAADNAVEVYLNGTTSIATTGNVYGEVSDTSAQNFASAANASFAPVAGENTLSFVVRNWQSDADTNPTGLVYKAVIDYCVPAADMAQVHVLKYLDGAVATATSSDNYQFPITWTYRAANQNEGATTTEELVLGNGHGGAENMYGADSLELEAPAYFTLSEVTTGTSTQVLPIGASCEADKFRLQGYRISTTSFEAAAAAELQTSAPVFNELNKDQFVIIANESCVGADELHVDSIVMEKATGTADGTFQNGWRYVFNLTTPSDEPNLAMKFLNWVSSSDATDVIPVANNMRISSAQANNGGATITLTAADTFSSPALVMTGDLNGDMVGRQVQVIVEVSIPSGTDNGSYSTTYTIQTNPDASSN